MFTRGGNDLTTTSIWHSSPVSYCRSSGSSTPLTWPTARWLVRPGTKLLKIPVCGRLLGISDSFWKRITTPNPDAALCSRLQVFELDLKYPLAIGSFCFRLRGQRITSHSLSLIVQRQPEKIVLDCSQMGRQQLAWLLPRIPQVRSMKHCTIFATHRQVTELKKLTLVKTK